MSRRQSRTSATLRHFDLLTVTSLLGIVLLGYYLVPLVSLFVGQSFSAIIEQATRQSVISAATTSLTASLLSTTIATVFGLPLAYWLARATGRLETVVTALVILPLVLPPIVSGMILLTVVGPGTVIGELATAYNIPLTRSLIGVVLAQTFVASPFVVITAKAAFESVDQSLEYASRSLGKSRWTTFRRVTLPLAWPGIIAGMTLAFARSIGEFGATIMLAYYPRTMPVQIWTSYETCGLDAAFPIAVILVGIAVGALVVLNALGTNPLE